MSLREKLEALEKVSEIATLAGLKGDVDEERMTYVMGFNLGEGRTQLVHVRITAKTGREQDVATFFSPCLTIKKGFLKGMSKEQAVDLLTRNENLLFARFGIWDGSDETMVVASVDAILDTLDPQEFEAFAYSVAYAADGYEQEHGQDQF